MESILLLSDILLAIIAIIWLFIATLQDIKKREVANWLSFSLIIIALGIRAIASIISNESSYFSYGILAMLLSFGVANLFYYGRIFAGGDAKLLTALGTVFATTPYFTPLLGGRISESLMLSVKIPFLLVFILNTLFVGSVYGLLFSIFFAVKNLNRFKKEFSSLNKKYSKLILILVLLGFSILIAGNFLPFDKTYTNISSTMIILFPFLFTFIKSVENVCMIKTIEPSALTEGDWLFRPINLKNKIIEPTWGGLTKEDLVLLQKRNKKVIIKQGIPFVPVFLIAIIISFFTNIVEIIIEFFI